MSHLQKFLSVFYQVGLARKNLEKPTFETLVYRFVEINSKLPVSPKKIDYEKALEHFRVQYFNEFMYKCTNRSEKCKQFIKTLSDFSEKRRLHKKDYAGLFTELCGYETAIEEQTCRKSLLSMEKLASDFSEQAPNIEVPLPVKKYISEISFVLSSLVEDQQAVVQRLKLEHDENTQLTAIENKNLSVENARLMSELADLKVVQGHIVDDNEDLRLSLKNINEERSLVNQKFHQCEAAYYDIRSRHETLVRESSSLKRRLEDSIRQQWSYYNGLKQHGLAN